MIIIISPAVELVNNIPVSAVYRIIGTDIYSFLAHHKNMWVVSEQNSIKNRYHRALSAILEFVQKTKIGEKPCDNFKFSEIYSRCQ